MSKINTIRIVSTKEEMKRYTLAKNISLEILNVYYTSEDGNPIANVTLSDGSCISFIIKNDANNDKIVGFKIDPEFYPVNQEEE